VCVCVCVGVCVCVCVFERVCAYLGCTGWSPAETVGSNAAPPPHVWTGSLCRYIGVCGMLVHIFSIWCIIVSIIVSIIVIYLCWLVRTELQLH
jgi:hypothetical protein